MNNEQKPSGFSMRVYARVAPTGLRITGMTDREMDSGLRITGMTDREMDSGLKTCLPAGRLPE